MAGWTAGAAGLAEVDRETAARLDALPVTVLAAGDVLFRPGEAAKGFVIVTQGRIEVFLTGPTGRGILLYAVEPGQSCVQSTLGLLGGEDYSGEAIAATDVRAVLIPKAEFLSLMQLSPAFRGMVFSAFAARMQGMMHLLERVAFGRIEARLASALLSRAEGEVVQATHQDLATTIGSAREVVSRRLEGFARAGWVATERGRIRLTDAAALRRLAAADEGL